MAGDDSPVAIFVAVVPNSNKYPIDGQFVRDVKIALSNKTKDRPC